MTTLAHDVTKKIVGIEDIFYRIKRDHNRAALQLYPQLKNWVEKGENRLERAVKVAIAGNLIDLGVYRDIKVEGVLEEVDCAQWGRYQFASWVEDLKNAHTLIYVGDNAGEIVFDRILLEEISPGRKIFFVVKGGPVSNDAILEDAQEAGIDKIAEILTTGQAEVGIALERAPLSLQKLWKEVDMIISKGQGNFETLSEAEGNIYFLLKAKCIPVARELGVRQGDLILQKKGEQFEIEVHSSGGLVVRRNNGKWQVLLVKKSDSGLWTLPKGHKEKGEKEEETASREVEEETGYKVKIGPRVGEISFRYTRDSQTFRETASFFLMEVVGEGKREEAEIEEVEWRSLDDALQILHYDNEKNLINKLKKLLEEKPSYLSSGHF
jgi:uncharacterized protein with ATP-grasp and redox domains/8-oxo-dGTP pyrophosphatase MutT (NUDIX family)